MTRRHRNWLIAVLVLLPALAFVYATVGLWVVHTQNGVAFSYRNGGTDLTFASSDGRWVAEENLLRGKRFEHVVIAHELYKLQCKRPASLLIRTKPRKRPWNWAFWFDNYDDLKWRVPYGRKSDGNGANDCSRRAATASESGRAEDAARRYLARLTNRAG
jgi:hypothetical protein